MVNNHYLPRETFGIILLCWKEQKGFQNFSLQHIFIKCIFSFLQFRSCPAARWRCCDGGVRESRQTYPQKRWNRSHQRWDRKLWEVRLRDERQQVRDVHKRNYKRRQIIRDATVNCKWSEETFTLLSLWYWPVSNVTPQTSSYGGRASEKGKPDLQCRRKESSGILQPGGEEEEGEQDPVELQGDGVQENQRQGGEVSVTCTGLSQIYPLLDTFTFCFVTWHVLFFRR